MEKSRLFLYLMIFFILGVAVRSFSRFEFWLVGVLFSLAAVSFWAGIDKRKRKYIFWAGLVVSFLLGMLRLEYAFYLRPNLAELYNKNLSLRGTVWTESSQQKYQSFAVKVEAKEHKQEFLVLIRTDRYPLFYIGDKVYLYGRLTEPQNFSPEFDYKSFLAKDGIYALMNFPKIDKIGQSENIFLKTKRLLYELKQYLEEKIVEIMPEPNAGFVNGIVFGERSAMPEELKEKFVLTGTSHITALSGYNITIVGRFFMYVLTALTISFYTAFWMAVAGIILFVIMTGASASVLRAGIMGILLLVAKREGRGYDITNALVFAAVVMLIFNPFILRYDAAFQLSFLAVLGLIVFAERIEKPVDLLLIKIKRMFRQKMKIVSQSSWNLNDFLPKRILIETISAQLAVLPLVILLFGRISLVSPIVNLLVLLAMPFSMAFGFASGLLGIVWEPLGRIVGVVSWMITEYQLTVIDLFSRMRFSSLYFDYGSRKWIAVFLLAVIVWLLAKVRKDAEY